MNLGPYIYALRWLVNDTFRQSLAGMVFWIMLGVSALAIVFCLGISLDGGTMVHEGEVIGVKTRKELTGPNPDPGKMHLLFGLMTVNMHRGGAEEVRLVHLVLAMLVAGTFGLLLTLVWTASFVPDFLQPSSAVVLFAKPAPRWLFLAGKFLGVTLFVALQGMVFFLGTWLALGVRTGYWNNTYLLGWPMLVLQFGVYFSVSLLFAVTWRSTMACVLGVVLFWAISYGVNYGRYMALALATPRSEIAGQHAEPLPPTAKWLAETGYWIFPKPIDEMMMIEDLLDVGADMTPISSLPEFREARTAGEFHPFASLATSVLFGLAMIGLAGWQLNDAEY